MDPVRQEKDCWHTGVAFVVKINKAESSVMALIQQKGRYKWLDQVGEKTAEEMNGAREVVVGLLQKVEEAECLSK